MKDFFTAQSYFRSTSAKYENTFTPDIVVINLGTNDNSKGSDPAQFKEDVKALIALVRSTYGEDVKIVWAANMMGACMQTYSQAAINELGGEAAGLYFCTLTANQEGGYYHPSKAGHVVAAAELANFIQENVISE
jgi:lysophospholipase L1-like esterase